MFDSEYENPMAIGEYGSDDDSSEIEVTCPNCGRIWNGYDCGEMMEWDCTDDAYASAFVYPVGIGKCRVCVWDERTVEQKRTYIAATESSVEVLEHYLCNKTISRISHQDNAEALCEAMIESEDDTIRSMVDDMIDDFICYETKTDFIDWIMEGGYDRVSNGS